VSYRIVLADDHQLVREGIRGLITSRMPSVTIVAEAATGVETLKACREHTPDLLVLDVSMPDLGGLEVLAELSSDSPSTKVIMVTQYGDREYVIRALKLGARGYVLKKSAAADLVQAITQVMHGRTFLDPSVAGVVISAAVSGEDDDELARLTKREVEVLRLTAEGRNAREAARLLGISEHTINRHRANLMEKLDLHSRAELVRLAIRTKLVQA